MQKLDLNLRIEIKADIRKQHDLYVNNLVGDVKANPRDFYRYINSQKKDTQGSPLLKRGMDVGSPNRNSRRQMNLMVSSRKLNKTSLLFWIDQPHSWKNVVTKCYIYVVFYH